MQPGHVAASAVHVRTGVVNRVPGQEMRNIVPGGSVVRSRVKEALDRGTVLPGAIFYAEEAVTVIQ